MERYNLTKRAYWVNGQREKTMSVTSQTPLPIGYIVLFNDNSIVAQFSVEGKVSALNSYLTSEYSQEYWSNGGVVETAISDVDGSFGVNDDGIFFFTVDGKYVEWNGTYLYSDIPMFIEDPIVKLKK